MLKTINISPVPKNSGDKKPQQNSPVSTNQVRVKKELPEKLTLFIPENLDIDAHLRDNPPNFKFYRDKFLYIMNLITEIPANNKDKDYIFIPLNTKILKKRVHNYRAYLDYLIENNILEENKQYIVRKTSKSFRFTEYYNTLIKEVSITYPTLIKSIQKFYRVESGKEIIVHNVINELTYLTKWYNEKLTIDYDSALHLLNMLYEKDCINPAIIDPIRTFNSRLIPVLKIRRGEFNPKFDTTVGRLHSTITQLKGLLRPLLKYDGKTLGSIDIVNSQPYLASVFLNYDKFLENDIHSIIQLYNRNHKKGHTIHKSFLHYVSKISQIEQIPLNVKKYISFVSSGMFYEEFGKILLNYGLITEDFENLRKKAKNATFSSIFSSNYSVNFNESIQHFKKIFPDVYNIFCAIKRGRDKHPALACTLQNLEAQLILHQACKIISEINPEIPIFTIHDSIVTTEEHIDLVKQVMIEVLTKATGINPTLKTEIWSS